MKRHMTIRVLLWSAFLSMGAVAGAETFSTIDFPGASATAPGGINSSGDIVGTYTLAGVNRGFLLSRGVFASIEFPGARDTEAFSINSRGDIAGYFQDAGLQWHGFVLFHGEFTVLDDPAATTGTFALGTDARGTVVGEYKVGQAFGQLGFAFIFSVGQYTQLSPPGAARAFATSINSREDVVGRLIDNTGLQLAWKLDKTNGYTVFGYPGATITNARGINAGGEVVGVYNLAGINHGFHLPNDDFTNFVTIDFPGATTTRALGINAGGDVVGTYTLLGSPAFHGFLLTDD
jgi:uncharacterized membrane protein